MILNKLTYPFRKPDSIGLSFFVGLFLFCSCGGDSAEKSKVLASVGSEELTMEEVMPFIPDQASKEDSAAFVRNFVDMWIRETVIVLQAEKTLPEEVRNVDARLANYRRSLLIYEFEKTYAAQKLDTVVTEEEIEKHYTENKADFKLADYIVKVLYVKLNKDQEGKEKVVKWYKSTDQDDLLQLEKFCSENAVSFYNEAESWIFFNDLLKEVPLKIEDKVSFLKNTKHVNFDDEEFSYYLAIYDYQLKDDYSPLGLERDNIKSRILNARKTELIQKMRADLLKEAGAEIKNYVEKTQ